MKISPSLSQVAYGALLLSLFLVPSASSRADAPSANPVPPRELTVVVVDSLRGNSSDINNFDRIARVFTSVFEDRKWPVKIKVERFSANGASPSPELTVFFKGIGPETPDIWTFTAWMTLSDHDQKWDFGVIRYRYEIRPLEQMDDRLDRTVRGAAIMAAAKIDDALFSKVSTSKR